VGLLLFNSNKSMQVRLVCVNKHISDDKWFLYLQLQFLSASHLDLGFQPSEVDVNLMEDRFHDFGVTRSKWP